MGRVTTSGANTIRIVRCTVCGQPRWQKHLETCPGPKQRIAPPRVPDPGSECGCNNGGWHEPDCVHVSGDAA